MGASCPFNCATSEEFSDNFKQKVIGTSMKKNHETNICSDDNCYALPYVRIPIDHHQETDWISNVLDYYNDTDHGKQTGIYANKQNITEDDNDEEIHNLYNANHDHEDYKEKEITLSNNDEHNDNITSPTPSLPTPSSSMSTSIRSSTALSSISVSQSQFSCSTQPSPILTKRNSKSWRIAHFNEYEKDLKKQIVHLRSQSLSNLVYVSKNNKKAERRHSLISIENYHEWNHHEMSQYKDEMLTELNRMRNPMKTSEYNINEQNISNF